VYQGEYGWIWIPAAATTYSIGTAPYAYLYTPIYGWTWYLSPWGAGAYHVGTELAGRGNVGPRAGVGGSVAPSAVRNGSGSRVRADAVHAGGSHGGGRR
jgi:hypothetical protein